MEQRVRKLEQDIMKLKAAYDQYFAGIERRPPDQLAARVATEVRSLTATVMTNTALRFRARQAISRYNIYQQYWQRNLRDMEEGRKPKRRVTAAAAPVPEEKDRAIYEISTGNTSNREMDELFAAVSREYERLGKSKTPDMEKVRNALHQQSMAIREKYGSEKVTFKVTSEGGKVTIKAGPADRRKS
jgi:hypothetical protein